MRSARLRPAATCARCARPTPTLTGLHRDLFCEANPIPVKWAVARMGLIGDGLRLPLTPLSAAHHERVRAAMRKAGIQA